MKIGILGAGCTGSIYASYLCACHNVVMVDCNEEIVSAINTNGLRIIRSEEERIYPVHAYSDPQHVGECELVIITVKTYQTATALEEAKCLFGEGTLALSLQNGLGNQYPLGSVLPSNRILLGTCAQGGTMESPGVVRHVGAGPTEVGSITGNTSAETIIAEAFTKAHIPGFTLSHNIMQSVWSKVIRNAGINAITALLHQTTDVVGKNPHAKAVCEAAVEEGVKIANASGCFIDYDKVIAAIHAGAERNGKNRTSMLQDVEHKRITEVMQINGAIVEAGKRVGISAPVNEMLTQLILATELGY